MLSAQCPAPRSPGDRSRTSVQTRCSERRSWRQIGPPSPSSASPDGGKDNPAQRAQVVGGAADDRGTLLPGYALMALRLTGSTLTPSGPPAARRARRPSRRAARRRRPRRLPRPVRPASAHEDPSRRYHAQTCVCSTRAGGDRPRVVRALRGDLPRGRRRGGRGARARSRASRSCSTTPASPSTSCGASTRREQLFKAALRLDPDVPACAAQPGELARRRKARPQPVRRPLDVRPAGARAPRRARSAPRRTPATGPAAEPLHDRARRGGDAAALPGRRCCRAVDEIIVVDTGSQDAHDRDRPLVRRDA